jgi:hypothetical protein
VRLVGQFLLFRGSTSAVRQLGFVGAAPSPDAGSGRCTRSGRAADSLLGLGLPERSGWRHLGHDLEQRARVEIPVLDNVPSTDEQPLLASSDA